MDLDYIPPAGSTTRKVEKEVSQANAAESKVSINEKVVQFRKNEKKKGKVSAVEPTSGPQAAVYPKNKGSSVVSLKLSASMRQEARKDNSASRSHSDLNPAAKSKASEYEKKGEVTVPDSLILKLQRDITELRDQNSEEKNKHEIAISRKDKEISNLKTMHANAISRKDKEISNLKTMHANAISRKDKEISNLKTMHANAIRRDRINQLEAGAYQKEDVKSAPSIELTKQEINFIKMKMIQLYILTDVVYYLLKDYRPNLLPRIKCDITYLYKEYRRLNRYVPSNSWGRLWNEIQNTGIGVDIESIRYIRNELDHSVAFHLSNNQFKYFCKIIRPILRRFDHHIRPSELYTDRLDKILGQTFWMRH